MGKGKKMYIGILILTVILVTSVYFSYAFFTNKLEEHGKLNLVVGSLNYRIESKYLTNNEITVPAGDVKEFIVTITSLNEIESKYELYYLLGKQNQNVEVGYSTDTKDEPSGMIGKNGKKEVTVTVYNKSQEDALVKFKTIGGFVKNELKLVEGNKISQYQEVKYVENLLNGADPVLKENLVPVTIDSDGTVRKAGIEEEWYDYETKKWANVVILENEKEKYLKGEIIPEDKIESYFVWIPRYRYKIFSDEKYFSLSNEIENRVQTIDVVFENKDTEKSTGDKKNEWLTHPAFTYFDTNGIWVGKFETGYKGAENTAAAQVNPEDEANAKAETANVIIKPNVYSWRGIQLAKAYIVGRNYEEELNSHMMKNTEWGAVAYLQHSIYGSGQEIQINNNSDFLTGYAAIHEPTTGYTNTNESCTTYPKACNEYDGATKGLDGNLNTQYFNQASVTASTTNNYSGIYDMSGGAWEYMMAGIEDATGSSTLLSGISNDVNSGFNGKNINNSEITDGINLPNDPKYYDIYSYNTMATDNSRFIFGDATGELGPFKQVQYQGTTPIVAAETRYISSWYGDDGFPVFSSAPWVVRGGDYRHGTEAGLFTFNRGYGSADENKGFRLVLAPTK